mmetsp:Transcript_6432/g.20103  ORF Transcript_6432/g.20103 Transcript_6432/m.20103 type:complete len:211 (-) Transcript_6432:1086-1718(-)
MLCYVALPENSRGLQSTAVGVVLPRGWPTGSVRLRLRLGSLYEGPPREHVPQTARVVAAVQRRRVPGHHVRREEVHDRRRARHRVASAAENCRRERRRRSPGGTAEPAPLPSAGPRCTPPRHARPLRLPSSLLRGDLRGGSWHPEPPRRLISTRHAAHRADHIPLQHQRQHRRLVIIPGRAVLRAFHRFLLLCFFLSLRFFHFHIVVSSK